MNRFRILATFAVLFALAAAFTACGGGGGSSDDPQTVVDEATLQGIESGDLDLSLAIDAKGEKGGHLDVSLSGSFQGEAQDELPELDLSAKANGSVGEEDVDFEGGLVLLGNKAYVEYEGTEYEVDSSTFSFIKSLVKRQSGGQQSSEVTACQEAASKLKLADFVDNLNNDGSADVGGTSTTKDSGDLNGPGAIDALIELTEDPACGEQLDAAGPLPSSAELDKAKGQVQEAVKAAHVDLYVGDDHIVRRISAQVTIEPPQGSADGGAKSVELDLDLTLTGVNEDQTISAPKGTKPLNDLFLELGVNPIELLGAFNGQGGLGGSGGLGSLLEGLGGSSDSSGGGSGSEGSGSSGGGQQAYYECLQEARTPVDLQNCSRMLQ